jgi:hypothetical protein
MSGIAGTTRSRFFVQHRCVFQFRCASALIHMCGDTMPMHETEPPPPDDPEGGGFSCARQVTRVIS